MFQLRLKETKEAKWSGYIHITCMREMRNIYEKLKGRYHLEDIGVDGRVVVKWILKEYDMML